MRNLYLTAHVALLLGCGKSHEQKFQEQAARDAAAQRAALKPLIDKHRDAATRQLAAFKAIGADAKALPPTTDPVPLQTPIAVEPGAVVFGPAWWFEDELHSPNDKDGVFLPTEMDRYIVRTLLEKGEWITFDPYDAAMEQNATKAFGSVLKYKLALVARASDYKAPKVSADRTTFENGTLSGDATLYLLPDGKRVGAFSFKVIQRLDSISIRADASAANKLADEFQKQIRSDVIDELQAYVSGTAGRATPGAVPSELVEELSAQLSLDIQKWALADPETIIDISGGDAKIISIEIESGPPAVVVLTATSTEPFEKHRAGLEGVVAARLGVPATLRIRETR